jgi:hypothetical protein
VKGGSSAEIALLAYRTIHGSSIRLDDHPFGLEGTGFHTGAAARAFIPVDPADFSITRIGRQGTFGAGINAGRGRALPALEDAQVMGKFFKGVLAHLNP